MINSDFERGFELGACNEAPPAGSNQELERGHAAGREARTQATQAEIERVKALERMARGGPIGVEQAQATLRALQRGELKRC